MKHCNKKGRTAELRECVEAANAAMYDMCFAGALRASDVYFVDGYAELVCKSYTEIYDNYREVEIDGKVDYYQRTHPDA